jgi:hypothetical protein
MAEIWERLPNESSKAYQAFCYYRDLGTGRGLDKALTSANRKLTNHAWWGKWMSKYNWVERARAYDDYLEQEKRKEQEKAILEMVERHTKEAMALQQKALERLKSLDPNELSTRDVLNYLMEAMKLERLSRGEPTEVQAPLNIVVKRVYSDRDEN